MLLLTAAHSVSQSYVGRDVPCDGRRSVPVNRVSGTCLTCIQQRSLQSTDDTRTSQLQACATPLDSFGAATTRQIPLLVQAVLRLPVHDAQLG